MAQNDFAGSPDDTATDIDTLRKCAEHLIERQQLDEADAVYRAAFLYHPYDAPLLTHYGTFLEEERNDLG